MKKGIWIVGLVLLIVSFFFDSQILSFAESLRSGLLGNSMLIISNPFFAVGVLVVYFILLKDKKKIFLLGLSFVVAYIVSLLLKFIIMRERPETALFLEDGYSFPSSHASVAFSTLIFMNREFPNFKWLFFLVAFLIAFSRLYFSVHYASDLIAGSFLGLGVGLVILEWKKVKAKVKSLI
tara:strand:- start:368 stop:907 length:540 start_codon:yes stop_codon:yes gene_type:complete